MKDTNYRKHNDHSHNSSTYHKKDGTPVRAILKREAQTEIKEAEMSRSKLSVINRIIKKAEEMSYEDVKLLEGSADSIKERRERIETSRKLTDAMIEQDNKYT